MDPPHAVSVNALSTRRYLMGTKRAWEENRDVNHCQHGHTCRRSCQEGDCQNQHHSCVAAPADCHLDLHHLHQRIPQLM